MKAVMISIHSKWVEKIASGEKTIEVRKTAPKIEIPFKCYIYETKASGGRGKVIGEFVCDEIKEINYGHLQYSAGYLVSDIDLEEMCLNHPDLFRYGGGRTLYGWHISDLKIYDQPKEISEFHKPCYGRCRDCIYCIYWGGNCEGVTEIAPQSWCYIKV